MVVQLDCIPQNYNRKQQVHQCETGLKYGHHVVPINLYVMYVGPLTKTGKFQGLKKTWIKPITTIIENADLLNFLIEKCASSALAKIPSEHGKVFVASPELYDFINKLLKSNDATGDAHLLCEIFSSERASYRYATEKTRIIPENTSFTIIGATQVPFAARIIARRNQGHGLLDRLVIVFPNCFRPNVDDTDWQSKLYTR